MSHFAIFHTFNSAAARRRKKNEMQNKFMYAVFDDLCSINETKGPDLQDYLQDVFSRLSFGEKMYGVGSSAIEEQTTDSADSDQYRIMEDSEPYGKLAFEMVVLTGFRLLN